MVVHRPKVSVEQLVRQLQFFEKPKNANVAVVLGAVQEHRVVLVLLVVDSVEGEEGVVALHHHHLEVEQECKVAVAVSRVAEEDLEEDKVLVVVVAFRVEEVRHHSRVLVDLLHRRLGTVQQGSMGPGDDDEGILFSILLCQFVCMNRSA
jgi:hypothetical protein